MIYGGDLRHNVQLQRYVETRGDRGQSVKSWSTYATVPAKIEELGGRKLEFARQLMATATHKISIRYYSGLRVTDRVLFGNYIFNLGDVADVGLFGFVMELVAESVENSPGTNLFVYGASGGLRSNGGATWH